MRGAAVVTADGLVAASSVATGLDPEVISGLASYLMMTTNRSLGEGGYGACTRLMLNATHGKAVLVQGEPKAWEFWKKSHSNDVLVQCLDALKHRMTPEVIALAQTYSGHPSADVARSAKVILQRSGAN